GRSRRGDADRVRGPSRRALEDLQEGDRQRRLHALPTAIPAPPRAVTRERAIRWIAGALIAVHAWLLLAAAAPSTSPFHPLSPVRKGPTFDEYFYIATGVAYVRTGDLSEN